MGFFGDLFGRKRDDTELPPDELEHWFTAEFSKDEEWTFFRIRMARPELSDIAEYTTCISIRWPGGDESGFPEDDLPSYHEAFEEAIGDLTMYNGHSFLMLVETCDDYKEWMFYAKDRDRFMDIFNDELKRHRKYPLKIEFYDDADWKLWRQIRRGLPMHSRRPQLPSQWSQPGSALFRCT